MLAFIMELLPIVVIFGLIIFAMGMARKIGELEERIDDWEWANKTHPLKQKE